MKNKRGLPGSDRGQSGAGSQPTAGERGHVPADDQVNVYDLPPSDPGQGDDRG